MTPKAESLQAGPTRPQGSPDIPQVFLPGEVGAGGGVYVPRVYGAARIQFADRRRGFEETRRVAFLAPISPTGRTLDWDAAKPTDVMPDQLLDHPPADALYLPLSAAAMQTVTFTRWARAFDRWIARTQRVELLTKQEPPEPVSLGPKRGGVSIELVAIAWELTPNA
jgi:hypothetical protein